MNNFKGFTLSIIIVMISFLISAISAGILADLFSVWKKPIIGAAAAFCVVIAGYYSAPSYKFIACVVWLIIGAVAAWILAGDSYYPEDHMHAYQLTMIPLLATYTSGLIAVIISLINHKKKNKGLLS